jgi:hypothetical protein
MYGKLAITCFTNQMYLYAERSITYLKPKFLAWFHYYMSCYSHQTAPDLLYSICMAELPSPFKKDQTVNTYCKKRKGKTV